MTTITITRLRRVSSPVSKHGNRLIAKFSARVGGITLHGCALLESEDGLFKADGSRGVDRKGGPISVHIHDAELQRAFTEAAVAIYRQACRLPGGRYDACPRGWS